METIYKIQTIKISLKVSEPRHGKARDVDQAISFLRRIYRKLDGDQEHFTILCLDQKNRITGYKVLFSGGTTETTLDRKIIFRAALLMGAVKLILCHNHPGGDPRPSSGDKSTTALLESLGHQLGLEVVDHIILGDRGAWSFAKSRAIDDYVSRLIGSRRQKTRVKRALPRQRVSGERQPRSGEK